jgi:hypothetical protein
MAIDYNAEDEELDNEIRKMYGLKEEKGEEEDVSVSNDDSNAEQEEPDNISETEQIAEPTVSETQYKNAVREMNRAQQELAERRKNDEARDEIIRKLQNQIEELKNKKEKQEESLDSDDEFEQAKDLYPEVVNPLLKMIEQLKAQLASVTNEVGNVKQVADRFRESETTSAQEKHYAYIHDKHPDVSDIAGSPEFSVWLQDQAPIIQQAIQAGTAQDVVSALDYYKLSKGLATESPKPKQDKLEQAKLASSPTIRGGSSKPEQKKTFTNAEIAKMTREEFMKYEDAIDEALSRGEIY